MNNDNFIKDLEVMPYHIIDRVVFQDLKTTIYFKSGNALEAKSPNEIQLKLLKESMLKNLDKNKVMIL